MPLLDVKEVQAQAEKEIREDAMEDAMEHAKDKLKDLYLKQEKAQLVLRNIQREIDSYLKEVSELTVYEAAGVNTGK